MSNFILTFDWEEKATVMKALKKVPGIKITSIPRRNGTLNLKTTTKNLGDETNAIKTVEDLVGVMDLTLV
ncbi:MAG: hypothetical protein V3V10_09590 [Planctomycetota bacterium]